MLPLTYNKQIYFRTTALHELAHMWFGNLVTMQWWDDLWLNEAFATYMAYLCLEKCDLKGIEVIRPVLWISFLDSWKYWGIHSESSPSTHAIQCPDITDSDKSENNFDGISYGKGSSFVQQLFKIVSEKVMK
jgi:aminopeptidase N